MLVWSWAVAVASASEPEARRALLEIPEGVVVALPCHTSLGEPSRAFEYFVGRPCEAADFVVFRSGGRGVWVGSGSGAPGLAAATPGGLSRWLHHAGFEPHTALLPFAGLHVGPRLRLGAPSVQTLQDLGPHFARLRMVKSTAEIDRIRTASQATARALGAAVRQLDAGTSESQLVDAIQAHAEETGAEVEFALTLIGEHTLQVHGPGDPSFTAEMGDLALLDLGLRVDGYVSDITRTVPVSGRFSTQQPAVHDAVETALLDGARALRAGSRLGEVRLAMEASLLASLRELGLIEDARGLKQVSPHGWIHFVGLDVHDAWEHFEADADTIVLEPGMVFALEPGVYLREECLSESMSSGWAGIGIRLEDVFVVTEGDAVRLSGLPTSAAEVERMAGLP